VVPFLLLIPMYRQSFTANTQQRILPQLLVVVQIFVCCGEHFKSLPVKFDSFLILKV
jgi:hypothetical protein